MAVGKHRPTVSRPSAISCRVRWRPEKGVDFRSTIRGSMGDSRSHDSTTSCESAGACQAMRGRPARAPKHHFLSKACRCRNNRLPVQEQPPSPRRAYSNAIGCPTPPTRVLGAAGCVSRTAAPDRSPPARGSAARDDRPGERGADARACRFRRRASVPAFPARVAAGRASGRKRERLEAGVGIEPTWKDLQSSA